MSSIKMKDKTFILELPEEFDWLIHQVFMNQFRTLLHLEVALCLINKFC